MNESTTTMTSSASVYTTRGFWERLWRTAGLQFVGFLSSRTWFTAADGAYSRFVSPLIGLVWIVVVSRVLLSRSPATRAGW